MRFVMKRHYDEDIRLFRHRSTLGWYVALVAALAAAPVLVDTYALSQLTFIAIYSIASVGMMLLAGYTGQVSLGHAAFFAIGAYTSAIITTRGGPFLLALPASGVLAALAGIVVGLPALRLSGLYLAIATMGFAFVVDEILVRWESLTRGNLGIYVAAPSIGPFAFDSEARYYYLALAVAILTVLAARNLLRSPTGRAMIAIRDSEIAAQTMGVSLARYKTTAFAISAFLTGLAGCLYAHKLYFVNPESFTILVSIEFLVMIIIGGVGSLHGAIYGTAFVILLPQLIIAAKDYLPRHFQGQPGLEAGLYGLMVILFIRFEPLGLYGRWLKLKYYFEMFPFYKKETFRKEKKYYKAERR
jgi:branched-chain amino acid transport system permease protein